MKKLTKILNILLIASFFFWLGRESFDKRLEIDFSTRIPKLRVYQVLYEPIEEKADLSLFWDVWSRLERFFIDKKSLVPQKMVYGAISGMVNALGDPYTVFLPPNKNKRVEEELRGSFEGIGIHFGFIDSKMAVIAPLKDTPAERAGLRAGDLILKIDGKETAGMSLPEAQDLIKGPKGTKVTLTILSEGEKEPRDVEIIRGEIILKSVEMDIKEEPTGQVRREDDLIFVEKEGVALVRVVRFTQQTQKEWDRVVNQFIRKLGNQDIRGMVLDLRDNPGGYLSGAVYLAGEFLDRGELITRQEKSVGKAVEFRVGREGKLKELPLVILINRGSASASEILAGVLQEKGRAKLVGEKTFGKGSIQEVQDLPGGAGLHITTARWLLPSGKSIDRDGLIPDFEVELTKEDREAEKDPQYEKAVEVLGMKG